MTETLRLFLVEDSDDIALLIRRHLERAGHDVTTCRTAADALTVLGSQAFHLVLLDQRLPDMPGLELLRTLRREGASVPVLMVTGAGDEHLAAEVLRAGALDYVVKDAALTFLADLPKRVAESVTRHRLGETNRLLIQSLESARDGVLLTDLQGRILYVNAAFERMTGYGRGEILGQTPRLFKSGAHPDGLYAELWRTVLGRVSWQGEMVNRRKDGTLVDCSVTVAPILDDRGRMTHFVGVYRDVGDRKRLERQLLQAQKMHSVGTLAGGIAHEFNNLLAGIQGYAALALREGGVPAAAADFLGHVIDLTDRAANLTRQLLAFARKPALRRGPVDAEALVRSAADLARHTLAAGARLEVRLDLPGPGAGPLRVLADPNQFQQVLLNLALNAGDAVREKAGGGPAPPAPLVFSLRGVGLAGELPAFPERVPAGDYVVIGVEDRGAGMTPEVLAQAFDPFYTTKGVGQGTGLGLPVAYGIVQAHQGYLTVETEPGEGTAVRVYLPRLAEAPGAAPPAAFEPGQVLDPEAGEPARVLVIDDEEAVLDVIRHFLEIAGHTVTCAASAREAFALWPDCQPVDLVILDWMIPREDGAKTYQRLQELRPGLPVLLCTGLLPPAPQAAAPAAEADLGPALRGAAGVLRKPFKMNELWYAVQRALRR